VVEDSQGNTAQDEVTITLGETEESDTEPPTVSWVKPVANGAVYQTASGTVELEVTASDSLGIRSVAFYWYDAVNDQLVEIATDSSAPYQASGEVDTINTKLNGIFAVAEDMAGNRGNEFIFIYRLNPTISLDLTEGPPGTQVTVQGSGWFPGETVNINFADPANKVAQATVGDDGSFEITFIVPDDAEMGDQKVIAGTLEASWQTDAVFRVAESPVPAPTPPDAEPIITLDPTEGLPGTKVTARGSGWPPGHDLIVQWDSSGHDLKVATIDSSGGFTFSFTVPEDRVPRRLHHVLFFVMPPGSSFGGHFVPVPFTVPYPCPTPAITLSSSSGKVGDRITVQGIDWLPRGIVTFTLVGPTQFYINSAPVPDSGTLNFNISMPDVLPGDYDLVFSEDHDGCELRVTKRFTIVASPKSDTQPPMVTWVEPVGSGQNFHTVNDSVTLEVSANGPSGIDTIELWVQDPEDGEATLIKECPDSPCQADLDISNWPFGQEWEITADVADNAGNWTFESIFIGHTEPSNVIDPFQREGRVIQHVLTCWVDVFPQAIWLWQHIGTQEITFDDIIREFFPWCLGPVGEAEAPGGQR
jgi:hypothetical protein